ncbi:MAG: tRNA (adenosine(37)-N6)-threonylcarbamoyltransferase complex ATPase subunit type 1 TsaE [Puniceicoccales bacterium]|jgi:tRNA threonylcarbamoyladenosine biosynthesis protein TsaE|nr:tRNA (adenosine(37)-N6)-threonylcarbamoyltransferase complex ATPase subunit type 1 TsaE [Puniceicoccales bacterium]
MPRGNGSEILSCSGIVCKTADETKVLAAKIAKILPVNSSLALVGDLGSGKTTFVQGLATGFGIGESVTSPSFGIFSVYGGDVTLLHVDAYRLDGTRRAAEGLMLDDFLVPPFCLAVEWPELLHGFVDSCDFKIFFSILDDFSRKISIERNGFRR